MSIKVRWDAIALLVVVVVLGVVWFVRENGVWDVSPEPVVTPNDTVAEPPAETGPRAEFLVRVSSQGFVPDRIEVNQDTRVVLTLRSTDNRTHGFALPQLHLSKVVEPNAETTFSFTPVAAGNFEFYSNVASSPNEANVRGVLVVMPRVAAQSPS